MSKTFLVAQREFMENMKTKTFWLGVFAAPIMIVLFYGGMFLLADKTDVRKYVVLDHSRSERLGDQWLSQKVKERAKRAAVIKKVDATFDGAIPEGRPLRPLLEKMAGGDSIGQWMANLAENPALALVEAMAAIKKINQEVESITDPVQQAELAKDGKALQAAFSGLRTELQSLDVHKSFQELSAEGLGDNPEDTLTERLKAEEIFAYMVIGEDPLRPRHNSKYVSQNVSDSKLKDWYARMVSDIVRAEHVSQLEREKGLSRDDVANIQARFRFADRKINEKTGDEEDVENKDKTRQLAPIAFVYALWMSIFIAAQMLLTNTVEEKSNRVIEVLLSSVSPTALMNGKIFGIAATGLTIVGSWALFLFAGIKLAPLLLPGSAQAKFGELGLDILATDPVFLGSFLGYFLSGYLLYAALLVAIGSVCNSLKEAQNLQQPVVFVLFVPLATMIPIAQDPNGTLAKVITYIPLYTPFAMMNRAGTPPPLWEYLASSAMILVSLWIAFRGAAKVFRVGILMTGKPPKFTEIIKWVRAPTR